jgi:hypothetical protein
VTGSRGQAATEYVATLLAVAVALAGAASVAVAVPGVGARVSGAVRTGLCIVGGDICRGSDAAAAGLGPCVTREHASRQDTTLDIAVVRLGGHGEWQLALRSDGRALVTRIAESDLGGTVGAGLTFTPAGIRAEAEVALLATYHDARAWRFDDARAAAAFLRAAMRDGAVSARRTPDVRWRALGGRTDAEAGLTLSDLARAGMRVGADTVVGLRSDGSVRTLTFALGFEPARLANDLPGLPAARGDRRAMFADVTWSDGSLRDLTLRTATGTGAKRLVEYSARLDLRDGATRAAAERLLAGDVAALATLGERALAERDSYAVSERRRGLSVAARLGIALGLEHQRVTSERRLVDAVAWVNGGPPQRRFDCLGV